MNLADDSELIIPGTTGVITAASTQANLHVRRVKESASADTKSKSIAIYLGELSKVHEILQGRVEGRPLNNLVPSSRIANNENRKESTQNDVVQQTRPYEDWFREH